MFLAQGRFAFVLRRFLLHSGSLDLLAKNDLGAHGKRPGFRFKPELRGVEKLAYIHSDGTLVAAAHYNRTYNSPFNGGLYLLCAANLSVLQHVVSNVNFEFLSAMPLETPKTFFHACIHFFLSLR